MNVIKIIFSVFVEIKHKQEEGNCLKLVQDVKPYFTLEILLLYY